MPRKAPFNDRPFAYHQEIELEVAALTNLGLGVGRIPLPQGGPDWVVMVPFTLPGERVRARVYRNHRNYSEADLAEVLVPSPDRVSPPCPLFGACGGCQYQHLAYPAQLAWKRRQVAELLEHMAGISHPVEPVVPSPRQYGYRSKITPHFNLSRAGTGAPPIGFLRQGTRAEIVDVPRCEIATEAINGRLASVRADVLSRVAAGALKRGATVLLRDAGGAIATDFGAAVLEEIPLPAFPPGPLSAPARTIRLRFLARDFFQNNPFILPAFVDHVRREAAGTGARFLVDAYCGSGLFAIAAAGAFERVAGVEISETSVGFARENAAANGVANAAFSAGEAGGIFAGLEFPARETIVLIDPPRKGCDESFLAQLLDFGPRAVVYVSCDPATQMRDLKGFLGAGYALVRVQPFDLFPQTRHLECVMTLRGPYLNAIHSGEA
jgi:23S rRNA (uracil1939-C5)-methyltransferase/tRNA (uracil-5-)-methyltransferase